MDTLTLARLQFGITTVYHFFFVPLTLGLTVMVAAMQTAYFRADRAGKVEAAAKYKHMTKFWGKLMLINFAMGVVTGIVQEFQFGMNWSEYSRFVGDIFGAPLAIEALAAFFIESTFLGLWIFGWDKLSKRIHLVTIWLVAFASNLSAYWILVANSWMQNPVGFEMVEVNGVMRPQMNDFFAVITNPNVLLQWPHVVLGGFTTAGFFVLGVSAWHLLRRPKTQTEVFKTSATWALVFGTVAVLGTMLVGHMQGQFMVEKQPMKLAAAEGLWEDEDPAGLSMFQIGNEAERTSIINIRIPSLLSFLTYNTPNGLVQGINTLNEQYQEQYADVYGPDADYVPPAIWLTYWSFRAMVGAGSFMFLLGVVGIFFARTQRLEKSKWFLRVAILAIILPYLANSTGWILTEFGRQPWIVQGFMRINEAISPNVDATSLWITLIGFTVVYGVLMVADIYLLWKYGSSDGSGKPIPAEAELPAGAAVKGMY